jgi:hypothetical protein
VSKPRFGKSTKKPERSVCGAVASELVDRRHPRALAALTRRIVCSHCFHHVGRGDSTCQARGRAGVTTVGSQEKAERTRALAADVCDIIIASRTLLKKCISSPMVKALT